MQVSHGGTLYHGGLLMGLIVCIVSDIMERWVSPAFSYAVEKCKDLTSRAKVLDLGRTVKDAVQKQGMLAWQYNTIGVSDAITMGGEGVFSVSSYASI